MYDRADIVLSVHYYVVILVYIIIRREENTNNICKRQFESAFFKEKII